MVSDLDKILEERNRTHGPFNIQAELTQRLKMLYQEYDVSSQLTLQQKEALDMIMHKIARIVVGNASFQDSWDDIAGYAKIGNKEYT